MGNKTLFAFLLISLMLSIDIRCCLGADTSPKGPPIVITSQTLTSDNKAKIATFEGDVYAKRGDVHFYADVMKIYYKNDGQETSNKIYKIESDGNVRLIRGKNIITSKSATYNTEPTETITFTGDPRASDGENVIVGTKITYYLNEERTVVEDSKVMIVEKESLIRK
ncbi:MAG: LptA/OstA family protein [Thermodesulfovibrionales bacterium]